LRDKDPEIAFFSLLIALCFMIKRNPDARFNKTTAIRVIESIGQDFESLPRLH